MTGDTVVASRRVGAYVVFDHVDGGSTYYLWPEWPEALSHNSMVGRPASDIGRLVHGQERLESVGTQPADGQDINANSADPAKPPRGSSQDSRDDSRGERTQVKNMPYTIGDHLTFFDDLGFNLIPLQPAVYGNKETGKRPRLLNGDLLPWSTYITRKSTLAERERWWPKHQRFRSRAGEGDCQNVGVVTGRVSNLVVLDIDDEETYALLLSKLPWLNNDFTVKSGRGYHVYMRPGTAENIKTSTFTYNEKLHHIKAEGGYVVAPPSMHYSGLTYSLISDPPSQENGHRWTTPELLTRDIAFVASELVAAGVEVSNSPEHAGKSEPGWVSELLGRETGDGERHTSLLRLAGNLARVYGPGRYDDGLGWLRLWADARVRPRISDREVVQAYDYAMAAEQRNMDRVP